MRDAYPDGAVQAELKRLYALKYGGEELDGMALHVFTVVAQLAYQSAKDLRNWAQILTDPKAIATDADVPCGPVVMGRLRAIAEEAMNNVKSAN